jgi:hypothetical protein
MSSIRGELSDSLSGYRVIFTVKIAMDPSEGTIHRRLRVRNFPRLSWFGVFGLSWLTGAGARLFEILERFVGGSCLASLHELPGNAKSNDRTLWTAGVCCRLCQQGALSNHESVLLVVSVGKTKDSGIGRHFLRGVICGWMKSRSWIVARHRITFEKRSLKRCIAKTMRVSVRFGKNDCANRIRR